MRMASPPRVNRRTFLVAATRPPRVLELSCERLYMQYLDACAAGRAQQFLAALQRDVAGADEIRLSGREWLTREDFRDRVGPLLQRALT